LSHPNTSSTTALAVAVLIGAAVGGAVVWVAAGGLGAEAEVSTPSVAELETAPRPARELAPSGPVGPEEATEESEDAAVAERVWDKETVATAVAIDAARRRAYHLGRVEVHSRAVVDVAERAMRMARNGQRMRPRERRELGLHYRNAIDSASPEVKRALGEVYSLSLLERAKPGSVSDEDWQAAREGVDRELREARLAAERAAPVELSMTKP